MATPKMQKRQTGQKSVHILLYLMMRGDMTPKKSASPETASLTVVFAHSGRSRGAQKRSSGTADRQTHRDESAAGRAPVLPRGHGHGRTSKSIPFTGVPPLHSNSGCSGRSMGNKENRKDSNMIIKYHYDRSSFILCKP